MFSKAFCFYDDCKLIFTCSINIPSSEEVAWLTVGCAATEQLLCRRPCPGFETDAPTSAPTVMLDIENETDLRTIFLIGGLVGVVVISIVAVSTGWCFTYLQRQRNKDNRDREKKLNCIRRDLHWKEQEKIEAATAYFTSTPPDISPSQSSYGARQSGEISSYEASTAADHTTTAGQPVVGSFTFRSWGHMHRFKAKTLNPMRSYKSVEF